VAYIMSPVQRPARRSKKKLSYSGQIIRNVRDVQPNIRPVGAGDWGKGSFSTYYNLITSEGDANAHIRQKKKGGGILGVEGRGRQSS